MPAVSALHCADAQQSAAAAVMRSQEAQMGAVAVPENPGHSPRIEGPLAAQLRRSAEAQLCGGSGGALVAAPVQVPPGCNCIAPQGRACMV